MWGPLSGCLVSRALPTAAGTDLRRVRNQRGLKASQLARLAGHDGLAAVLSERGPGRRARAHRRRRRHRDALHTQGGGPRPASSPEAVLGMLVQVPSSLSSSLARHRRLCGPRGAAEELCCAEGQTPAGAERSGHGAGRAGRQRRRRAACQSLHAGQGQG